MRIADFTQKNMVEARGNAFGLFRVVFIGLVAGVLMLPALYSQASGPDNQTLRTISLGGSAKVSVDIDYAELRFSIVTKNKSFELAQSENLKQVDKVLKDISAQFGIKSADLYTDDYSLNEYWETTRTGESVRAGYQSVTSMRIKLRDLQKYRDMLIALLKLGVNSIENISYIPKELSPYKIEGLKLAFAAARAKAEALAAVSGTKIARIISIEETGSYLPEQDYRSMVAQTNMVMESASSGGGSGISVGDRTLTVEVQVVFELQ